MRVHLVRVFVCGEEENVSLHHACWSCDTIAYRKTDRHGDPDLPASLIFHNSALPNT